MKKNWRYWWTLLYFVVYLVCFFFIEHFMPVTQYHMISTPIDHMIPFNEWFVFLYISWFGYIFFSFWYFFFKDKKEYLQMITFLFTGMTLFVVVSVIYPNSLDIRPKQLDHSNIALILVDLLYKIDTPTNVFPSIHVYNSLAVHIALHRSEWFQKHKAFDIASLILCVSICMSTVLLKQHSITDVIGASILMAVMYTLVYATDYSRLLKKSRDKEIEMQ